MGGQKQRLQAPVQIKREHPLFKIIKNFIKSKALNHCEAPQSLGHSVNAQVHTHKAGLDKGDPRIRTEDCPWSWGQGEKSLQDLEQ